MKRNKILFLVFLIIFVLSCGGAGWYLITQQQRQKAYEDLAAEVEITETPTPTPEVTAEATPEPTATEMPEATEEPTPEPTSEPVVIPIDFATLQSQNSEIYAWIRIPDTVVDYPVAQSATDNLYYLDNCIDGTPGLPGSIYTENINSKEFTDPNTVIYGHDMNNGSMFGGLSNYMDSSYMSAHEYIYIYTPEHIFTYRVFGGITYDDRHILNSFDFTDVNQYQSYLDSVLGTRNFSTYINSEVPVSTADRILTLSTCTGNSSERFLVEAVLVNEE